VSLIIDDVIRMTMVPVVDGINQSTNARHK
jgi:hypothetical protein